MKLLLSAIVAVLLWANTTQAQTADSLATVIFYRTNGYAGSAATCNLIDSSGRLIRIYNHAYYEFKCKPGQYIFSIKGQKNNVYVDVDSAGGTYYYKIVPVTGFWSMSWDMEKSDARRYAGFQSSKPLDMSKPLERYNKRGGLMIGAGPGFSDEVVLVTTDDIDVSIGFAGGFTVGGNFGIELSKYFDVEIGYNFRKRGLTPHVKNATMTFKNHQFYAIPSLIIPLGGGYKQRFKIGAGLTYAIENTLNIDTKSIQGGISDEWTYKNSVGYQIRFLYEVNASKRLSINYGVRYYDLDYKYESSKLYFPTTNAFSSPKGNGLDLLLGLGFHF